MYRQESEEPIGLARHGTRELTEFEQDRFRPQVIAPPTEDNALRRLLGQDFDKFIEELIADNLRRWHPSFFKFDML